MRERERKNYRHLAFGSLEAQYREFHHKAKIKKNTKKQKDFSFLQLDYINIYTYSHSYRGSCVRRVYMFSLRELAPNLSLIDFIKNVNALLVNIFFVLVCWL